MKTYNEVPETCPECQGEGMTTAVDVTIYNGTDIQCNHDPGENSQHSPATQPVRVFCDSCGHQLTITDDLADQLAKEVTNV